MVTKKAIVTAQRLYPAAAAASTALGLGMGYAEADPTKPDHYTFGPALKKIAVPAIPMWYLANLVTYLKNNKAINRQITPKLLGGHLVFSTAVAPFVVAPGLAGYYIGREAHDLIG
jgi:hypothetical protein